jgi:hypothetical protein
MTVTLQSAQQSGALHGLGFVRGAIRTILLLEALAVLTAACAAYAQNGASWLLFAALFLAPDLSFFTYAGGKSLGAAVYNAVHTYAVPLVLLMIGPLIYPGFTPYALIWIAHIGLDRALGYGLKYGSAFGHTHLGLVGRG